MIGGLSRQNQSRSPTTPTGPDPGRAGGHDRRRCGECHTASDELAASVSDELRRPPWVGMSAPTIRGVTSHGICSEQLDAAGRNRRCPAASFHRRRRRTGACRGVREERPIAAKGDKPATSADTKMATVRRAGRGVAEQAGMPIISLCSAATRRRRITSGQNRAHRHARFPAPIANGHGK